MSSSQKTVVKFGIPLVLGGAVFVSFLALHEDGPQGFRNVVYADSLAGGLPTACLGLTKYTSPAPVVLGDFWSDEKCIEIGGTVAARAQMNVLDCIGAPVSQNILDAFSSHAHNVGAAATCASRAMGLLNTKQYEQACDALAHKPDGTPAWSFVKTGRKSATGQWQYKFVQGLYNRRLDERSMCLRGVAELRARYDFDNQTWRVK